MNSATPYLAAALRGWQQSDQPLHLLVDGWSMAPLLHPGDRISVVRCSADSLRRGDIVLIRSDNGGLLTHRLIRSDATHLYLAGDALDRPDPPVPQAALLGIVTARTRNDTTLHVRSRRWGRIGKLSTYAGRRLRRAIIGLGLLYEVGLPATGPCEPTIACAAQSTAVRLSADRKGDRL